MEAKHPPGLVLHGARRYDLLVWLLTLGHEGAFRERLLEPANLRPGERVLDVGCGTGTLAIAAKRRVGPAGVVHGIDASPAMVARATHKAAKAGLEVSFAMATAQELPFAEASFDVVVSTLMFHHLGRAARLECAREMKRVLAPGGRAVVVDFAQSTRKRSRLLAHFHRHGGVPSREIAGILETAGFAVVECAALGLRGLEFCVAK